MRVTLKNGLSYMDNGKLIVYVAGSIADLATDEAKRLIDSGRATFAEQAEPEPEPVQEQAKRGRKPKG